MRFGLVGTGYWAGAVHAAGIRSASGAELAGVWGRNPDKAGALAGELGVRAYGSVEALVDDVDAVSFSVPPEVQAQHAVNAARAGKHLVLEKPVATTIESARQVADAVAESGVASVVFFTARFKPEYRAWLAELREVGGWRAGWALWLSAAFAAGSPFDTPWRHEKGALWDIGPHLLTALSGPLGPVQEVASAVRGTGDLVHLVLRHEGGATSTASMTHAARPEDERWEVRVWGEHGVSDMPADTTPAVEALRVAVEELQDCARSGRSHELDVRWGLRVVELLAAADAAVSSR